MEDKLDEIAEGNSKYIKVLDEFYHPLQKILSGLNIKSIKKSMEEETDEKCPKCGSPMIIKWGRNGKFMACSNYPECKSTRAINADNTLKEEPKAFDGSFDRIRLQQNIHQVVLRIWESGGVSHASLQNIVDSLRKQSQDTSDSAQGTLSLSMDFTEDYLSDTKPALQPFVNEINKELASL